MLPVIPHHGFWFTLLALAVGIPVHAGWLWMLRHIKAGQPIRSDGPLSHISKQGTPTMGGVATVVTLLILVWLTVPHVKTEQWIAMGAMLGMGAVGLADDVLKLTRGKNLGLRAWQKLALQMMVGLFLALAILKFVPVAGGFRLLVSSPIFYMGWAFLLTSATSNAFNITDGLDGLATLVLLPLWLVLGLVCIAQGQVPLAGICFLTAAVGPSFLFFNWQPAKMFMGEVGILAYAGLAAAIALLVNAEWILLVAAAVPVAETLSVMLQVSYFKWTGGQRIFKMSPLHHHFELLGWSERRVVLTFSFLSVLASALALATRNWLLW